ncbi:HpcH/HpaI aldolase/citrate lyase family protein [Alterinioella nitratireducens]|uniref:HpcH/HpaI aldolase/citrate lyase family protein n=1 Tax=Alterinioella nitratireducens TaxID=2735915 RepID=UPI00155615BC|nr:CoA ester lyase [Alterinioella nitratireducens]NPD21496.1 CoA ester lyase [Alterinioella nitratireducens]
MPDISTPDRADKPMRSLLFVPADSEKKIAKGLETAADALVLDLEDSVMPERKSAARAALAELLAAHPSSYRGALWVRINPLNTEYALEDLCAVVGPALKGILLPKCEGPGDVETASRYIDALARRAGLTDDRIGILPVVTETAAAPFTLGAYREAALPRLWGMTWGAEDLSSAIGAATNMAPDGNWAFTYKMVRSQCLLAAKAANVQAIETLYVDFSDDAGLRRSCVEARREGFNGRFAIHPAQVDGINESFMPATDEVNEARSIVAAFAQAGNAGTVGMHGRMLDIPHLKQAQKVLELHESFGG